MRTLTGTLEAAQKGPNRQSVRQIKYYNGASWVDVSSRCRALRYLAQPYGCFLVASLQNNDGYFNSFDYKGNDALLSLGFKTSAGDEVSQYPDLWVRKWSYISKKSVCVFNLVLEDVWSKVRRWKCKEVDLIDNHEPYWSLTNGTKTYKTILSDFLSTTLGITLYASESEDTIIDTEMPTHFWVQLGESAYSVISRLLQPSRCVLKPYQSGFRLYHPVQQSIVVGTDSNDYRCILDHTAAASNKPITGGSWATYWEATGGTGEGDVWVSGHAYYAAPSVDYAYDGDHTHYSYSSEDGVFEPNSITARAYWYDATGVYHQNVGDYADPVFDGTEEEAFEFIDLPGQEFTEAELDAICESIVKRAKLDSRKGDIDANVNVGQEPYDNVQVVDSRSGLTGLGRIGTFVIDWQANTDEFTFNFNLGGLNQSDGEVENAVGSDMRTGPPSLTKRVDGKDIRPGTIAAEALQNTCRPFFVDIEFPDAIHTQNSVSWKAGTIGFSGGAGVNTLAGSLASMNSNPYFIYFVLGNSTLQVTQVMSDAKGADRDIVAVCQAATQSGDKAKIFVGEGKTSLFNADAILCSYLSALTADMGLLNAGEIRLGSGTVGSNFTGIRIYESGAVYRVAGYNNDTIQAYFDSDGKFKAGAGAVVCDTGGISIYGKGTGAKYLTFKESEGGDWAILYLDANVDLAYEGFDFLPKSGGQYNGNSTYYWGRVYADTYYGKNTTIQSFEAHDDVRLLREIKHDASGKLKLDTFPPELVETDEEMDEAFGWALASLEDIKAHSKKPKNEIDEEMQREYEKAAKSRATKGVNLLNWNSLLMGAIVKLADIVDSMQDRIDDLEAGGE